MCRETTYNDCCSVSVGEKGTKDNELTHLRAEAESAVACLDMTSIRALVVSENFEISTGAGTLRYKVSHSLKKDVLNYTHTKKTPRLTVS